MCVCAIDLNEPTMDMLNDFVQPATKPLLSSQSALGVRTKSLNLALCSLLPCNDCSTLAYKRQSSGRSEALNQIFRILTVSRGKNQTTKSQYPKRTKAVLDSKCVFTFISTTRGVTQSATASYSTPFPTVAALKTARCSMTATKSRERSKSARRHAVESASHRTSST